MIDVTVPVHCQVMDLQLFLTEFSKVQEPVPSAGKFRLKGHGFASDSSRKLRAMIRQSQGLTIEPWFFNFLHDLVSENPSTPLKREREK